MSISEVDPLKCIEQAATFLAQRITEIIIKGEFSEEAWLSLESEEALGSLSPSNVLARRILDLFKSKVADELYFDAFVEYLLNVNLHRLKLGLSTKKWLTIMRDALQSKPPSDVDGRAATPMTQHAPSSAAKLKVEVAKYNGKQYGFSEWHASFENVLNASNVPQGDWIWLLLQSMEPGSTAAKMAHTAYERGESYDQIIKTLGQYFDRLTKTKVHRYFTKQFHQQKFEDITCFYLRFVPQIKLLERYDCCPSKTSNADAHNRFVNDQFLVKIHENYCNYIEDQLEHLKLAADQVPLEQLKELGVKYELRGNITTNPNGKTKPQKPDLTKTPSTNVTENEAHKKKKMTCYFCGKKGHSIYKCNDRAKGDVPPCESHVKYRERKGLAPWVPGQRPSTNVVHGNGDRFISLTALDIKVHDKWVQKVIAILDTGGCENNINAQFARRLKLKISRIHKSQLANAQASAVNGATLAFVEYVELPVSFKGKVLPVRFYLVENCPRPLLLGNPWLAEVDGVVRSAKGTFTIHSLGVTMGLISSNRADSASMTMATFDMVHAPMPPTVPNALPVIAASELPRHVHQPIMADNFIDK